MTVLEREATIRWLSSPPEGVPHLSVGSGSLHSLPLNVDWRAAHPLATSPGELLAGAIGSTFAWLAAEELARDGTHARELIAYVSLTIADDAVSGIKFALSGIACRLLVRVSNVDDERLNAVASSAMNRSIRTLGLREDALAVTVDALLQGA